MISAAQRALPQYNFPFPAEVSNEARSLSLAAELVIPKGTQGFLLLFPC